LNQQRLGQLDFSRMAFKLNDEVFVKSLKRWGVVSKLLSGGKLQVAAEGLVVHCDESDLVLAAKDTRKKYAKYKVSPRHHPALKPVRDSKKLEELDLHGLRVHEALELVKDRIDRAILADLDRV